MSRYTLICPECHAEVSLSARRLLVRVDEGTATSGEALFTCLSCQTDRRRRSSTRPLWPSWSWAASPT